ncbi:MAG: DUF4249 domain-containing protein [Bacteroidales bacterium]|nr:DUF4249 domain-containing protein [Bacteroidales bacterium]MCF8403305.1 DUF4249 domain-containing protein [Bacteroidales bacterium]
MRIKCPYILLVFIVILSSCIDEFNPQLDQHIQSLVVDGKLTNEPGPFTVSLSLSSSPGDAVFIPYEGCSVEVVDNTGNAWTLHEQGNGKYSTLEEDLQGIPGRTYSLIITTPDGKKYSSGFEELISPVAIDSVYHEVEFRENPGNVHDLAGIQFYVDSEIAELGQEYFLWELEATYKYTSDYTIRWIYNGSLEWFHNPDSLYFCWTTSRVNKIFTSSTNNLTIPKVEKLPLHFVNTETRALSVRYSLLVAQYSINQQAFDFWNNIRKILDDGNSLYTTQPFQIAGNIKNLDDPTEPVYGYFLVAGKNQKRIFVNRPSPVVLPQYYVQCTLSDADFERYGQLSMSDPVTWPVYAIETPGGRRAVPEKGCVDCRERGGTINKPVFWID